MPKYCKHKKKQHAASKGDYLSILSGLSLAILPKCPICIFAYSSAITMCSGTKIQDTGIFQNEWMYVNFGLLILTFGLIVFNYKGIKTLTAGALVLIAGGVLLFGNTQLYPILFYLGSILLLFAVWLNGSFAWFFNRWKSNKTVNFQSTHNH